MERKTKIISMGNMKGGVGKSTITSFIANYINKETEYNVCVVDSDDLQQTLWRMRQRDIENGANEEELYDMIQLDSITFPENIETLYGEYDFIFVDLPGNLKQKGVVKCYTYADYLFMPTDLSFADLDSTILFYQMYENEIVSLRKKAGLKTKITAFLNKVNTNTKEYKQFIEERDTYAIEFMKCVIPESKVDFQRNANTVDVYKANSSKKDYKKFCEEFLALITTDLN